jgi:hypothetical protein
MMGGSTPTEPPAGSMAYLSEPFTIPGERRTVDAFKKYPNGRWGTYPGNEWSVGSLAELVAVAKVRDVVTPEQAVESITSPAPDAGDDPAIRYMTADVGDVPDAQAEQIAGAIEKAGRRFAWLAGGGVALVALFFVGRAILKK